MEGDHSSLDKQTYGAILKNRFPNLVLVPSGGKGLIRSFSTLLQTIIERTVWGVEFFMLCDRDAISPFKPIEEIETETNGKLKVLNMYHLENYFLDETILSKIFSQMEPDESWLTSPVEIRSKLRDTSHIFPKINQISF